MDNKDNNSKEEQEKLLTLLRRALEKDQALRDLHSIGDKFRFIRDRLTAVLHHVEEKLGKLEKKVEVKIAQVLENEVLVYVYLFNAQGMLFETWQKMLLPSVLYEYSVNRPIYTDKSQIEAYIRSKPNKLQHGYITIAIQKHHIVLREPMKDAIGGDLIKVKEGALVFNRLFSFTHAGYDYLITETGVPKKK